MTEQDEAKIRRLLKVAAQSDQAGEAHNAVRLATQHLERANKTWDDVTFEDSKRDVSIVSAKLTRATELHAQLEAEIEQKITEIARLEQLVLVSKQYLDMHIKKLQKVHSGIS